MLVEILIQPLTNRKTSSLSGAMQNGYPLPALLASSPCSCVSENVPGPEW